MLKIREEITKPADFLFYPPCEMKNIYLDSKIIESKKQQDKVLNGPQATKALRIA